MAYSLPKADLSIIESFRLTMKVSCAFNAGMEQALEIAIDRAGGATKLAKAIGGITPQAISQWKVCPVNRVVQVEGATGISRHELRPDIFGVAKAEASAA